MDRIGSIWAYTEQPQRSNFSWICNVPSDGAMKIDMAKNHDQYDWTKSKWKRPEITANSDVGDGYEECGYIDAEQYWYVFRDEWSDIDLIDKN